MKPTWRPSCRLPRFSGAAPRSRGRTASSRGTPVPLLLIRARARIETDNAAVSGAPYSQHAVTKPLRGTPLIVAEKRNTLLLASMRTGKDAPCWRH